MIRILNAEPCGYSLEALRILQTVGQVHAEECSRERLLELAPDFDVIIVRLANTINDAVLSRCTRLKWLISATTGLNHIDLDAAQKHNISVLSLRGEIAFLRTVTATAELTWGLLLALLRHVPQAHSHVLQGGWDRDLFIASELSGKTLGIVGFGRLGRMVAEYARAFQMQVLVNDPQPEDVPPYAAVLPLEDLLPSADVVSLHVNLKAETHKMFGVDQFALMKPGALFINTARGELIDESALLTVLQSGRLGGAALDVLSGEADGVTGWLQSHPLFRYAQSHDNLLITPHIGGATKDSMAKAEVFMAKKLVTFLNADAGVQS